MKFYPIGINKAYCVVGFAFILAFYLAGNVYAQYNPRQKLLARRAAKIDALRNLTEIIYGLELDSRTTVREFITASDIVRSRFKAAIRGAEEIDYQELTDGTAEVVVEITLGRVETILGRQIQYNMEVIQATGYGVPPSMSAESGALSGYGAVVKAKGFGLPPDDPGLISAEKDLLGMRAAKVDALRNLAEAIYRIQITSESVVRDFAVQSDDVRTRLNQFIQGARVVSETKLTDGRYQVEVESQTEPLKQIIGIQ